MVALLGDSIGVLVYLRGRVYIHLGGFAERTDLDTGKIILVPFGVERKEIVSNISIMTHLGIQNLQRRYRTLINSAENYLMWILLSYFLHVFIKVVIS